MLELLKENVKLKGFDNVRKTENLIIIGPLMKRTQPFKIIAGHMILLINILIIISYKNSEDFKPGDPELFDWGVPATIAIINTIGALILILLILSLIGKIAIETSTNESIRNKISKFKQRSYDVIDKC